MVIENYFYHLIFIYLLINLLIIIHSEVLNNPFQLPITSNPIIKNDENEIEIYSSNNKYKQNPTTREITSTESFCSLSQVNTLLHNSETNNYYIYSQSSEYLISLTDNNCLSKHISETGLYPDVEYIGNIYEGYFNPIDFYFNNMGPTINLRCMQLANEMILYAKTDLDASFYFIESNKTVTLGVSCNIEDIFYCKKLDHSLYICILICSGSINIQFFAYVTQTDDMESNNDCQMINAYTKSINDKEYRHIMALETNEENEMLICAINYNDEVQCFIINYSYEEYDMEIRDEENPSDIYYTNKFNISFEYTTTDISFGLDTSNNENCLLKKSINDEYIICCGEENKIKCGRISTNFELLNSFNLNIEGMNTIINLISSEQYLHILYKNELDSIFKYYEYSIYSPQCPNKIYSVIPLGSITDDINNLIIRDISSNYYIKFLSYSSSHLNVTYNGEFVEDNYTLTEKILINNNNDYLIEIISINDESINDLELNYEIILEETFTKSCTAKINILECYPSCKICSKSKDESDNENHNCIKGECNFNYYQAADIETNCWNTYEAKSNWYLDNEQNKFFYCSDDCPTCDGPTNENCLSCKADTELKYLYNKKCYEQCPDGYYPSPQSEGYYKCEKCYSTCETCERKGYENGMNCLKCKPNSIKFQSNCFLIHNDTLKTFYIPDTNRISSCLDKYDFYIMEDSDTCIPPGQYEGYYISNPDTGVLSPCHPDCKTCEQKYTEDNTKCTTCKNEDLNFFNGNCIETCPEGYYSKPKSQNDQKKCLPCFYTCQKCEEGEEKNSAAKLQNMNCLECKKNTDGTDKYIKVDKNCFAFIDYAEDKITFDTSLINTRPADKVKTCHNYELSIFYGEYECKSKPSNTYYINTEDNTGIIEYCNPACATCNEGADLITGNTNCLLCSDGYYKKEDSDTNCILESLIEDNYYKYTEDNIFYKCDNLCSKCVRVLDYKTDMNNMGCASCIINYYIEEDTTNCYDLTFLQTHNNYYLSAEENMFKKCYLSCKSCSIGYIDDLEHNCDECLDDYYFEENTKNCFNLSAIENGYFFDNISINVELGEKPFFKKCHPNCQTCSNYSLDENMNCISCKDGFYKLFESNNCIDDITNKGYYEKDGIAYPCSDNCLTCSDNVTEITENNLNNNNEIITNISNNCLSCDFANKNLFLVENINNCETEAFKNQGFYLSQKEDNTEIFQKCYKSCSLCNKGLEINPLTNEENHNCIQCANNYYRLLDDIHIYNCYGDEMIQKGYRLVRNHWQICYESCDTCSSAPTFDNKNNLISHNCLSCYEGYNFIYQTNDCANETFLEKGYYLDDNDNFYKKCDISCATCDKYSNSINPKCKKCNNDLLYFKAENLPNDICYNKSMIEEINDEYVLSERLDDEGNSYSIWGFCYKKCTTCLKLGNDFEHGCTACIPQHYLIYNTTNCVTDNEVVNNGYYFNKTLLQYVKCDESCINCFEGPNQQTTNCKQCNNDKEYFSIEGKTNTLCRSEQTIEEGYYLNILSDPPKWKECYENCATCEYKGNEQNMKCITCRTNLVNKFNKTRYFIFLKGNCLESCENNLYLTKEGDCVMECPEGSYKYNLDYNYTCLEHCPKGYYINFGNKTCELSEFPENVTMKEFKTIVFDKINIYLNPNRIINFDEFKSKILSSNDLSMNTDNTKQIFYVDNLEGIIEDIKTVNNLNSDEKIVIILTEYDANIEIRKNLEINQDSINLGKNAEILIYDLSGNKLTIPQSNSNFFSITKYIGNILYIDFDESKWFSDQDIDTFDATDSFFNDICYPFKTKFNSDVTLKDRRNSYFHNVNFCGEYCTYNKIDYDKMNVNCLCNSSLLNKDMSMDIRLILNSQNKFSEELSGTNLLVMKCINLMFDSNIIKTNAGFITNMILLSTEIIFFVFFFKNGLKPIKNFLLIFEPNFNASPPKLKNILALAEPKSNKDEEIKKSKLINHLINAKKRKKNSDKAKDDALVVDYSQFEEIMKNPNSNEYIYNNASNNKNKNDESNKSDSEESKSNDSKEKNTTLKKNKSHKRNKIRNIKSIKPFSIKENNKEKIEDVNDIKNDIKNIKIKKHKHKMDNNKEDDINPGLFKSHKNLRRTKTSINAYLNKNTEEENLNEEEKNTKKKKGSKKSINKRKNNLYSRHELSLMKYEEAIKNKVIFSEIYWYYLIEYNFILYTIISDPFLNLLTIKISYFCFRLELIFAFNAFFYTDKYITDVFENEGNLNFFNSLPKAVYSFLITTIISIGLKFLLNNKREILNIIRNKDKSNFSLKIKEILDKMKTKLIIYFSIQFTFTLFFLYYCSVFCAVYQNSQIFWFYGCLETILFDIIFSCLFCLFIGLCKYIGIKKRIKCLYIMSFVINYV